MWTIWTALNPIASKGRRRDKYENEEASAIRSIKTEEALHRPSVSADK